MKASQTLPCLAALGLVLLARTPGQAAPNQRPLDVYWIDSEGGGSTLIVTPTGESVLIDTGNPGGRDPGRIVAAAKLAGLTRIDYVLLTHYHVDHFGGAAEVARQISFTTIYQRAIPEHDPDGNANSSFPLQIKSFREIPAKRVALAAGVVIPLQAVSGGPKLELRCLAADQKFVEPTADQLKNKNPLAGTVPPKPLDTSDNANSAVFLLEFGAFRFFDGGDLTWNLEDQLVSPANRVGRVDVYQTDHHGLDLSNNPILIKSLTPTVAVMNNGPRKGGEKGAMATLKTLPGLQGWFQVHRSMNVPPEQNTAEDYIANLEEFKPADKCPGNFIKMSVAPDGASYVIVIPATGFTRTYQTARK